MLVCLPINEGQPGWICHKSETYNGRHTPVCLDCGHARCDPYVRTADDDALLKAIRDIEAAREASQDDLMAPAMRDAVARAQVIEARIYDDAAPLRVEQK